MKKITFLFLALCFLAGIINAQAQTSISGKVTDSKDGSALIGVTILVEGTQVGTSTDLDGNFNLTVPAGGKELVVSYVGYKQKKVAVKPGVMNITMEPDELVIGGDEGIVVMGYGSGRKVGTVIGSVKKVDSKDIQEKPVANMMDALQGKVAGLQVYTSSGEPTEASSLRLHGVGSLVASNTPLYIIDGAPFAGNITAINQNDIESITVLKDASATSIYGSRAANGVIVITTRQGKRGEGKATITFRGQYAINNMIDTDFFGNLMNSNQLAEMHSSMGLPNASTAKSLAARGINTDWEKIYFKQDVASYTADLSISGGSDRSSYYVSGSYLDQPGLAYRSNYERYTVRTNLQLTANDWLRFGATISGSYDKRNSNPYNSSNNTNGTMSYMFAPWYSPYDANGKLVDKQRDLNATLPHYQEKKFQADNNVTQVIGNVYAEIRPMAGLTFKTQLALNAFDQRITSKQLPSFMDSYENGYVSESFYRSVNQSITNTLEYKFNLDNAKHAFTVLVGQEGIKNEYSGFRGTGEKTQDDRFSDLQHAIGTRNATNTSLDEYNYLSFFGRADYSYLGKYFVDFSLRNDASSRFGSGKRNGTFVSGGLMWKAKAEKFLENNKIINDLDVKFSIGTIGNSSLPSNYGHLDLMAQTQYQHRFAYYFAQYGNPNLSWEAQTKTTLGFTAGLFNKVRLNLDFYDRYTRDMLIPVAYAPSSGITTRYENVGEMDNKGIDIQLDFDIVRGDNYYVTPYINYNYNHNEIKKLFDNRDRWVLAGTGICWIVDKPISFYYPLYAGLNDKGYPTWYLPGEDRTKTRKDPNHTTTNFDTANLEQNTGKSQYAKQSGGFGFSAGYKNFAMQADFSFVLNKSLINNDRFFTENPSVFGNIYYNQSKNVMNYWTEENKNARFPRLKDESGSRIQFTQFDDRLIENASFLRLKNLSFSYNIPAKILAKTNFFSAAKVYVTGRNLFTVTDYTGIDPEVDSNISIGSNPNTKQYMIGVELTF
ncbi:TonB-linked SusC/RagA family outer membrane protein [Dysgonomonas sp. PH5-45]|uniref:SusC/RagA family TonB-linked outer membrane protein n=1 Tax=unclassified Dysgonomonas TaxID=2630389 RepID=UPI0024734B0F|nr:MULTISPECIES: SusC/RagA family TonB-linked outer membrane protein [unclassified Dysgonomonas]MDH6355168.1 TonB-linked SusC/RagA family outer membrane protein [Dysgonomonas sp. PH5-45]MDH6388106.1 TonB-linked SusC/RagA family outer membrane protein [Dysgonomonas sp. PH5-37]